MAKYTINRGGKDYTFDSQEKYEEFYNLAKETAKRHGTSTADVFKTQYDLYANNPDTNPSSVGISAPTATSTGGAKTPSASVTTPTYQSKLDDTINKILNREEFTFDLNGDALYNQYKDSATRQGKLAMEDAIGMASAMTGGYGNSYAQSVGQQAFNQQLEGLNDVIPEIYQLAYDKYNDEGEKLLNDYAILSTEEEKAHNRKIAETTDEGLSDAEKWIAEHNLDVAKAGFTYDEYGNLIPLKTGNEKYTGAYKMTASELRNVLDNITDNRPTVTKTDKKGNTSEITSIGPVTPQNSAGYKRALQLLEWLEIEAIDEEDMDYLAAEYKIPDAAMDLAIETKYGK